MTTRRKKLLVVEMGIFIGSLILKNYRYGAKLCNIFSKVFTVETADSASGKRFKQVCAHSLMV